MITKIDAAERQLDTAIKLFFENIDHLSSYTLANASREITDDLCKKREQEIFSSELERLGDPQKVRLYFKYEMELLFKPEHRNKAFRLLKKNQNFLKHADNDPDETIEDIPVKELSAIILFSIINFSLLEKRITDAMGFFLTWFAAAYPDVMKSDADIFFSSLVRNLREEYIDIESDASFYVTYKALKRTNPYLFPKNLL